MRLNVSAAKAFQESPRKWWYRYVLNRVPLLSAPALEAGTGMHHAFEQHFTGLPMSDACALAGEGVQQAINELMRLNAPKRADQLDKDWRILSALLPHWQDRFPFETISVEEELETQLGTGGQIVQDRGGGFVISLPHKLFGTPDRIAVWGDQYWHVQNRSLSASTPIAVYLETAVLDWHELAYAELISRNYTDKPYGGTLFNIVRKLALTGKNGPLHKPEECFVQEFIPLGAGHRQRLLRTMIRIADEMDLYLNKVGMPPVLCPDTCTRGRYGNSTCPYFRVCAGYDDIHDDALFKDATDREGMPVEAEQQV